MCFHLQHKNIAIKRLQAAEHEWKSLPLADKRNSRFQARLVKSTEDAAMSLYQVRYPSGPLAMEERWVKAAEQENDVRAL